MFVYVLPHIIKQTLRPRPHIIYVLSCNLHDDSVSRHTCVSARVGVCVLADGHNLIDKLIAGITETDTNPKPILI